MKYSQYNGIRKLLESDIAVSYGYDINEWDSLKPNEKFEQIETINEGFGLLAGILGGLLGLGLAFRKKMVSLGVKKLYLRQLTKNAQKFKVSAMNGLLKAIKPYTDAKNNIKKQEGVENWKDLDKDKRLETLTLEKKIDETLSKYISKIRNFKTEEINKKIENSKRLSESHKYALKTIWETLSLEIETSLISQLIQSKIIENPSLIEKIKTDVKTKTDKSERNIRTAWKKIKDVESKKSDEAKPSDEDLPKIGDKYVIIHEKVGGEKEGEIIESSPELIKIKTSNSEGKEMNIKITPDNFKKLKKKKIENSKTSKPEKPKNGEGEIRDKEI